MRKPKSDAERTAKREWMYGDAVTAMLVLRINGYGEAERYAFLREVVGATESGLSSLELYRDSYLGWLAEQEKPRKCMCGYAASGADDLDAHILSMGRLSDNSTHAES